MSGTPTSSSKIPRHIKAIIFKGDKTIITTKEKFKPAGSEEIINEEMPKTSDQPRHNSFNRAMERFAVHAMVSSEFTSPFDKMEKPLDAGWWDDHLYEDDARFSSIKVLGVIITSKNTYESFQILVQQETSQGEIIKFKSPPINTIKVEGWNYPLQDFARLHLETLLMEADEYRKGKSSLGQLKMALVA